MSYCLLHLLEGARLDLADALARHAEFVGKLLKSERLLGQAAGFKYPSTTLQRTPFLCVTW